MKAARYFSAKISGALRLTGCLLGALLCLSSAAYAKHLDNEGGYHPAVPLNLYSRLPFEGQDRKCLVHVPASYDGSAPTPLIVCLHGGGGDIGFAVRMFGFNEKADKEGFIVAYPNGSGRLRDHVLTWNVDKCCGYAEAHHEDDVGFIRHFLNQLENDYNIDSKRIYVVGFSNGAMMAYKLACQMPEKFAAFAVISGSMNGTEQRPALPISGLIVHGVGDRHIPIQGGGGKLAKWGFNVHAKPLDYAVNFWAAADGCQKEVVNTAHHGEIHCRKYLDGKAGSEVIVYTIDGYRHSWPGGHRAWWRADPPCPDLSATDMCWEFFCRHTRDPNAEQLCHQPPAP